MEPVTLKAGDLEATFAPGAGMIGTSLRHRGDELLEQRDGLDAYVKSAKTFGIPLLHPWANRLDGPRYSVAGKRRGARPQQPAGPHRGQRPAHPRPGLGLPVLGDGRPRHRRPARPARLRRPRGPARRLPLPAHAGDRDLARRRRPASHHAADGDDRPAGAGVLRLPPLPDPPRRRARGLPRDLPGLPPDAPRRPRHPHRHRRGREHPARPARRPHLRRRLLGAARAGRVRPQRRRPAHRRALRRGLPLRPGLGPARRALHLLRADDGAHQRARHPHGLSFARPDDAYEARFSVLVIEV